MKKILQGGLELIFPPRCLYCDAYLAGNEIKNYLCSGCERDICLISSPLCSVCGMVFSSGAGSDHLCGSCLRTKKPYALARAAVLYTPVVKYLLHCLKYRSDTTVLPAIKMIIDRMDRSAYSDTELILPVPLHINRLRSRCLNQSLILARLFYPRKNRKIFNDVIVRIRDTIPQANLNGEARRKNLRKAFQVIKPELVRGKSVCLVDDVLTTGTTIQECSRVLTAAGVKRIKVLTLARVDMV